MRQQGEEVFLGIDPTSSEKKASACALLGPGASLLHLTKRQTDGEIVALAREWRPSIVAIDSPLGYPKGMCCLEESCPCRTVHQFKGRLCEQEMAQRGIPLYFTTKRSIIKPMIYRAIRLAEVLTSQGCQVLEVYPYACKVLLFGKLIPKKTSKEGLDFLRGHLARRIPGLATYGDTLDHDLCDALVAAYTARLHSLGQTEGVGLAEEVPIVIPKLA